ncbi:hypothetical protein VP018_000967 [Morganella morganii]|uniref:hypothetical protein n=1 Tax=Morganella morganii TaxID=582 RepID=UPI0006945C03|nr:hypothetical protein [Morganella morganii]EMD0829188.1 hypothetical protein [Morganella morganii]
MDHFLTVVDTRQPFLNVVKELKPQIIIVLGTQLWDQLPEVDGVEWCWVKHPSSGSFSYDEAFSNFKKSLENIKNNIRIGMPVALI